MTTQLCTFAPGQAPTDLGADASGPYWLVRKRASVEMWAIGETGQPVRTAVYPCDGGKAPASLVAGARSVLYRHGSQLFVGSMPLMALGVRPWEAAAAVSIAGGVLVRAFAAEDKPGQPGHSFVAWTGGAGWIDDTWGVAASFTAARPLLAGDFCGFVSRVGGQVRTEIAEIGDVVSGAWQPKVAVSARLRGGQFLGNPVGCLEPDGTPHWSAALWRRWRLPNPTGSDYSQQMATVYADAHQAVQGDVDDTPAGQTSSRIWLPSLAQSPRLGTVLGFVSRMPSLPHTEPVDAGQSSVAVVRGGHVVAGTLSSHPGFSPLLAWSEAGLYCATSIGIWRGAA